MIFFKICVKLSEFRKRITCFFFSLVQFVPFRRVSRVEKDNDGLETNHEGQKRNIIFNQVKDSTKSWVKMFGPPFPVETKTKQNIQTGSRFDIFDECKIGTLDPRGWG